MRGGRYFPMKCVEVVHALHKCSYPSCVGQTSATWVFSPFGFNILLSLVKGKSNNYAKLYNELKSNNTYNLKICLFCSQNCEEAKKIKKSAISDIQSIETDFSKDGTARSIGQWVLKQGMDLKEFNIEKNFPTDTKLALVNLCKFQCPWQASPSASSGRFMKVHNSFSYTQDINYETRIMELPMQDKDSRLIVVTPNAVDPLNTLFRRLTNDGLAATFASIRPLFSVDSVFVPPCISIASQIGINSENSKDKLNENITQYGTIQINEKEVHINVLTCLYSTKSKPDGSAENQQTQEKSPFFFVITYKDTPIFSGQYVPSLP